jgi:hypothetical protein
LIEFTIVYHRSTSFYRGEIPTKRGFDVRVLSFLVLRKVGRSSAIETASVLQPVGVLVLTALVSYRESRRTRAAITGKR